MKEGKHERKKFKIIEAYSVLILIATLFIGVGYAQISDIEMKITGTVDATVQQGVFISDVVNTSNVDADTANSTINYYTGTALNSKIVLSTENTDSSITYQVTIYNNSEEDYVFIGVITDTTDETFYSNENIKFELSEEMEEYVTTIPAKDTITFQITFKYAGTDTSNGILESTLNFRFKELPRLTLDNNNQTYTLSNIYPNYTTQEYEFAVSNYDKTGISDVPMSYQFETTIDSPLTAEIYDSSGNKVTGAITINGDGENQIDQTYKLKIIWKDNNLLEYANENWSCSVVLTATPNVEDKEKYLDYKITQQFSVNITSAPFYFTANATSTAVSISNNSATVAMTVNNYNSDTEYNVLDTDYEISILNNSNFTFSSGESVISRTISAGKTSDSFDIALTATMSNLDITESLTLKIVSTSPYPKEIEIPITITLHKITVTLNANGGSVSPSTITVYQSRTYADLPTPTRTGYTFNGWYTSTSGGTKYTTSTSVTSTSSTQTLYAQWTSRLLADYVSVGDYVNYPVNYSNVGSNADGGYIPSGDYLGWRVLSVDTSTKVVRLVTAGIPLTYDHPYSTTNTSVATTSVTNLTTGFFSTAMDTSTGTDNKFHRCGFKTSSGSAITTMSALKSLFNNKYTQVSSSTPKVQAMTKADLDAVWGSTTTNGKYVTSNDLLAIPSTTSGSYAAYHLATKAETYYLWCVRYVGGVIYSYGEYGVRPVVTLKATVEKTGQDSNGVWQITI